ncbi:MAG: response regulator [Candidatus Rokubacteria bacterium]|nr:response regulator [Candidatus Rokubacteria bacterium]
MSTLLVLESPEAAPREGQWFPDPRTPDRLPTLGQAERRVQAIPEEKTDAARPSARARIMVVDDMLDVRQFLSDFLEEEGYAVEAFGTATDALQRLDEFRPGVILLDILLPGLSGLSALEQIRATNPEVGVIMVTGIGDDAIARKTLAQGAFDYIAKPIDLDYLKRSLETFLLV